MPLSIRRTHVLVEFPSKEAAETFLQAHRDAGLGKARLSGVDRDKVKLERPGRIEPAEIEARWAAAGLAERLAKATALKFRYEAGS